MEQKLKLYKYDNGKLVSFPSKESQIEIGVFTYTAKRMGDAPTITATINYKECLDNLWTGKECVIFNDEFFYVKNIPTSSYSNTDSRYKHECTFVNERSKLNGVLFTDVVDDKASDGKPVSNSSKFSFNGNITEFVSRLNASLRYAKLQTIENSLVYGYHVVIDEGTKAIENFNDTFNVSFEDKTISEAIQEIYNSYNIPYYFEGKTVHVGLIDEEHDLLSDIDGGFKYGVNNELISISKSNKNNKIINRITALGSSENIPYYYPNETEKGSVAVTEYGKDTTPSYVELFNPFLFAKRIGKDDKIHYLKGNASWSTGVTIYEGDDSLDFKSVSFDESVKVKCKREDGSLQDASNIKICFYIHVKNEKDYFRIKPSIAIDNTQFSSDYEYSFNKDLVVDSYLSNERGTIELEASDEGFNTVEIPVGSYQLWITYKVSHRAPKWDGKGSSPIVDKNVKVKLEVFNSYEKFWFLNDSTTRYNLEDFGLRLTGGVSPYNGMAFAQKVTIPYYPISQNLILPIYRSTQGEERFYNAYNATYKDENGNYYDFKNEYAEDAISEHIVKFDDIKPTIKGVEYNGRRIDKFVEFAYDKSDNDLKQVVEDKEEYQHPYFFAKLPPLGFNLFDHALETGEMTISMTSGHCAGCSFTIMVNDANKNTVQVDEDGNLKYDEGGYVLVGSVNGQGNQSPVDSQNDTTNNSVWIALKKDIDSFGTILPSSNIKPSSNDTFVITNILLPQEYIEAAEERLKNEAIKYMAENNSSKFSFSIKFSRIFLAENPTIFDKISENSRIAVNYNGSIYPLHVSSYSYKMSEGALLPEIDVSLTDSVVIATNAIESAVSEAKADVLTYVDRYATLEEATTIFIRKDKEDYSPSPMVYGRSLTVNESHKVGENLDVAKNATIGEKTTTKAIQVGEQASVGNYVEGVSGIVMKIDSDGSSYMELDRLKVRMKAYFDELEVQKVNTVGGKMIMSPAGSFTCGAVLTSEELLANGEVVDTTNGSFYRCFFNAVQDDEQIENKFIVGDFAFSQSFNLTGRSSNKMYWREVVGVSSTYVDLSYDKCALDSDIPSSGDIICQLGSKVKDRQNAIVMTTVDEYAPAITLHYGIDKFSLSGTEIIQYGVRDGKAFFNSYGDMFLGDKPVEGVSKAYMKYTTEGGLEIKGKLTVGSTYNDKELGELFDAQQESLEEFKASVTKEFENIRNEMDGAIDTWFGEETPTLENKPASDWLTNTDKDSHLGDLYYSNDGKAYRFQYTETEGYYWATIEDSEVVKALELAQKALDTADGKRTIFIEQPKPPYQVGDLWAAGENQPLKRCIKSREDILESFYESDWDLADNSQAYADAIKDELEESINTTKFELDQAIADAEAAAKDYTDEGKAALQLAIGEMEKSKANLDEVYTKASKDDTITKLEARALEAAQAEARAAQALAEEASAIYADGVVTKEEEARIEQAKKNLAEAKEYAEEKADEAFNNAKAEVEKFDYLKAALKESTDIDGGLIQTSLIKLGYTNAEGKHQVMSGTNGIADSSLIGGGIATWWGGEMHDLLDYYTWDNEWIEKENVTIPSNIPSGLIRFDGTGYFAKGNIWWDETGNLHADPLSFFVGEDSVGALLASFQVVNDKDGKIDYLIPKAPFSTLTVGELRIKDENGRFVTLKFKDGVLLSDESFASEKSVSAKGVGQSGGSGSVSYDRLDTWEGYTSEKAGYVLSAALGWDLKTMIENLDLGDFDLSGYLSKEEASKTYATQKSLSGYQPLIDASNKLAYSLISGTPTKLSDFTDDVVNGKYQPLISSTNKLAYSLLDGTPTALKNPNALKFGNKSYDGSEEKIITAADLGAFTEHQAIYALTVKDSAGTTKLTYTPNDKASEITLTKAMVGLGDVENTKLSAWAGTSKITTVGTITTGTWNAKKIANDYIVNPYITIAGNKVNLGETLSVDTLQTSLDIVTKNDEQTISGVKTFSSAIKANGGIEIPKGKTIKFGDGIISWDDTNNAFKFHNPVYSTSSISAKGIGTGGSGGGGGVDVDWNNFPSSIIPSNSTYDLGSNDKPWDRVFASYFGTDNKITYIAGKSITLNSELYFSNGIDHIDTDGNAYLNGIQAVSVEAESITLNGNNVATIGDIDSKLSGYAKVNVAQKFTGTQTFASIEIESALSNIVPDNDDTYDLGGKDNRWSGVYATLIIADEVKIADEYAATEGYVTRKLNAIDIHNYIPDVLRAKNIIPASEDYAPDQTMSSYSLGGASNVDRWNTVYAHILDGNEVRTSKIYNTAKDDVSIDIEDEDIIITAGGIIQLKGEVIVGNAYKDDNLVATRGWVKEQGYGSGSADLSNYYTKEEAVAKFASVDEIDTLVADEIAIYLDGNFSVASDTTNAVSVTIGSNTKNITAVTLKTSLGLGGAAYKAVGAVASGNTGLVTGGAVYTAIKNVSDIVTEINDNYASVGYVDREIEILEGDLAAFITATEVDTKLQSYATQTWVNNNYQTKITSSNKLAYSLISGTPTSLPASDVYSWAKAASKPSYSWNEITGKPTIPTKTSQLTNDSNFFSTTEDDLMLENGIISTMNDEQGVNIMPSFISATSSTGTDTFKVDSETGNTVIAGTLSVGGKLLATTDDLAGYLPLSGGTIENSFIPLTVKRSNNNPTLIKYENSKGVLGYIGIDNDSLYPIFLDGALSSSYYILHSGNYTDYTYSKTQVDTKFSSVLKNSMLTNVALDDINAIDGDENRWNNSSKSFVLVNFNNAIAFTVGGVNNNRAANIQVGHATSGYAQHLGTLYLNKLGGDVYIGENLAIHEGNIGSQSVSYATSAGNADTLGGLYYNSFYQVQKGTIPSTGDISAIEAGSYWVYENRGEINPVPSTYSSLIAFGKTYYSPQLCVTHNARNAWLRGIYNTPSGYSASDWHELAFTDSNVASATKLATARTIWGQSFDGSKDITYDKIPQAQCYYFNDGTKNVGYIGKGSELDNVYVCNYIEGDLTLFTNNIKSNGISIKSNGNVLIGTTTDYGYKLYVNGDSYVNGNLTVSNSVTIGGVASITRLLAGENVVDDGFDINANNAYIGEFEAGSIATIGITVEGNNVLHAGNTSFTRALTSGTKIGSIKINGTSTDIFAPAGGSFNGGTVANYTKFSNRVEIGNGGDDASNYKLYVGGNANFDDLIDAWGGIAGDGWEIMDTGDAYFQSCDTASDYNLKTILKDVRLSLGTMANAPLVQFDWKNKPNSKHHIGTIAQYWDSCLPEVVSRTKNDTLALSYGELGVAMGISLAKEMTEMLTRMDNTDSEVDKLKKRISELEKEIENLKAE